ncbi:CRTAC1 family protein [Myxococcota bacterium]|nr:CRTAC1 family protein [Myxococcota bacterium]
MSKTRNRGVVLCGQGIIVALTGAFFVAARDPGPDDSVRKALASRFAFEGHVLPTHGTMESRGYFDVNPHLRHVASWMSSIGSGVTFFDADGDGLANDLCITDPRTRSVLVAPAPTTGERYPLVPLVSPGADFDGRVAFPTGCRVGDFDEDGRADLLVFFFGRSPVLLYQRAPVEGEAPMITKASFTTVELLPKVEDWYTATGVLTDVDGDGHVDIVLGNYFRENDGIYDPSSTAYPEFHRSLSNASNGGVNRLYLWAGTEGGRVKWREVEAFTETQAKRWTLAVSAADLDGDALSELYFANDFGPDTLFLNRSTPGNVKLVEVHGRKGFMRPKSKVLGNDSFKGMGIDFADINGDARLDMFISNIAGEWQLEESHHVFVSDGDVSEFERGVAPYHDESEALGMSRSSWGWDTKFGDFDNDGEVEALQATGFIAGEVNRWPELHQWATGNDVLISDPKYWPDLTGADLSGHATNPFYVRGPDGRFVDLAVEVGLGAPWVTRGFGLSDVDADGDLDLAVANQWDSSYFFENQAKNEHRFLGLKILARPAGDGAEGVTVVDGRAAEVRGRPAIGAVVEAKVGGARRITWVDGGGGHSGARSPDVHLGLGALPADAPIEVEVRWRSPGGLVRERLTLKPGWHTVVLPARSSKG